MNSDIGRSTSLQTDIHDNESYEESLTKSREILLREGVPKHVLIYCIRNGGIGETSSLGNWEYESPGSFEKFCGYLRQMHERHGNNSIMEAVTLDGRDSSFFRAFFLEEFANKGVWKTHSKKMKQIISNHPE